jgi:hypothetical protein
MDTIKLLEKTGSKDRKVPSDKRGVIKSCGTV